MKPRARPAKVFASQLTLSALSLGFAAGMPARQDTNEPPVLLPPVMVKAKPLIDSPATVTHVEIVDEPLVFQTPSHVADRTANFHLGASDARSFNDTVALRGVANTPIFGPPAVTFYIDGLPLGTSFLLPTDLAGFARAELHRGPTQNTRFGRAGSAGVMTFVTPEPAGRPGGELQGALGNYDAQNVAVQQHGAAGGPADAYVSAAYASRDGYVENTTLGRDVDFKESVSGLARIRIRPTRPLELTLLATAQQTDDGAQAFVPLGGPFFTVARDSEGETRLEAANIALGAAVTGSAGRLSAVTSYSDWELAPYTSVLAFGTDELTNLVEQSQRTWNEELKFVSAEEASIRWEAGMFFSSGTTEGAFTRRFGALTIEQSAFEIESRDLAGFGEVMLPLSQTLSLTAGLRVETARRRMDRRESVPTTQTFALHHESSALLPQLGLSYAPSPGTTLFAALGAGYKPGGFSAFTGNPALATFGPERTKALEAGITRTNVAKTTSATLRAFYYDITGYQIERSFATSALADDYLVVNAGRARSFGAELEVSWKLLDSLTAFVDIGVTNSTLREFRDPFTGADQGGNRTPYAPVYDASIGLAYRRPLGWFGEVGLTANGKTFYTEDENPVFAQSAYGLLRARIGYATTHYRITVFGDNLTDEEYYRSISPGTFHGTPGAPRTFGIEAAYAW